MELYKVKASENKCRLDKFLAISIPDKSRSYLSKLIDDGNVLVNGKVELASYRVKTNDEVSVEIPEDSLTTIKAQDIPLDVVYEDSDILIINKERSKQTPQKRMQMQLFLRRIFPHRLSC